MPNSSINIAQVALVCLEMKKLFPPTFALIFILLTSYYLEAAMASSVFCNSKCRVRCSKAGANDRCLLACNECCDKCNCVPSGTYGNRDQCPCYRDITTGNGNRKRPKCP